MNNTQIYPFERNRYYPRKRMSSGDFTAEQTYMNNKRRFLNGLMYGAGIVCGLGVFSLDDLSLLIESGVAIDGMGREIVVETSDIRKLSAMAGFEDLRTNHVSLCLRYKEVDSHKVYAIEQEDPSVEFHYNRVRESYTLFLIDTEDIPPTFSMESEFLVKDVLLSNDNFLVTFRIPATASRNHLVRAVVEVEKLSDVDVSLNYFGILQMPAFLSETKENNIRIELKDIHLSKGEKVEFSYWMETLDLPVETTNIILQAGSAQAFENDKGVEVPENFSLEVRLSKEIPRALVNREIGRMSLEMRQVGGQGDYIRLADLELVRTESAYIIEDVIENGVKTYIVAPAQEMERGEYMEYFVRELEFADLARKNRWESTSRPSGLLEKSAPEVATGVVEIPLSEDVRKGDIYYSGEIMHGLGKGNVYVDVGYEYISEDDKVGATAKSTIYGDPDIFAREQRSVVPAETAVRVLNDKGSFVIGARILGNVDYIVLLYRWVAIKFPTGEELSGDVDTRGMSISPETPTVRIQ
ncbi:MAG: hypothetical protein IJ679_04070, partial [Lachnospiraceae bacterium]|nr:hypothetical protein [Lachnospiraceae bacterium]